MAWFVGQSAVMIVLAFLLGLFVGWLIWARRLRALRAKVAMLRDRAAGGVDAAATSPETAPPAAAESPAGAVMATGGVASADETSAGTTTASATPASTTAAEPTPSRATISGTATSGTTISGTATSGTAAPVGTGAEPAATPHIPSPRGEVATPMALDPDAGGTNIRDTNGVAPTGDAADALAASRFDPDDIYPAGIDIDGTDPAGIDPHGIDPHGIDPHGIDIHGIKGAGEVGSDSDGAAPGLDVEADLPAATDLADVSHTEVAKADISKADISQAEASTTGTSKADSPKAGTPAPATAGGRSGYSDHDDQTVADELALVEAAAALPSIDNLERIEGIGPKFAAALVAAGIRTFDQLAATDETALRRAVKAAGYRLAPSIRTWTRQARLLADGDETGFEQLIAQLTAGRDGSARRATVEPATTGDAPIDVDSGAEETGAVEPALMDPALMDPAPADVASPDPVFEDSGATEPTPAEPTPAEPEAAEPAPAEPEAAEPDAAEPGAAGPVAKDPVAEDSVARTSVPEDLARIEGIGPRFAAALVAAGIRTFAQLADSDETTLRKALTDSGLRFAPSLPTWATQARLLADGNDDAFAELTARLIAGRSVTDDLERIEGVGPKIAAALRGAGIRTYRALANSDNVALRNAIQGTGLSFAPSLSTWARQARLLADGDEEGFADLTRRLIAGRDDGRA